MDYAQLFEKSKREKYLDGKGSDVLRIQRLEVVAFQKLIQVYSEKFSNNANVFPEYDKIFDSQYVLAIFNILFLYLH